MAVTPPPLQAAREPSKAAWDIAYKYGARGTTLTRLAEEIDALVAHRLSPDDPGLVEAIAAVVDMPPWNPEALATASPGYREELEARQEASREVAVEIIRAALAYLGKKCESLPPSPETPR